MANLLYSQYERRFSVSATGITAFVYLFFYLLAVRFYQRVSYRDPTSLFDAGRAYERGYPAGDIKSPVRDTGEQPALCIGIVSVKRREDQYVELTVGSSLDGISERERKHMLLYLRIGNMNPTDHPIYAEKWVETLPDRLLTYSQEDPDFLQLKEWEDGGWYWTLINECYKSGADYIAMLEAAMQALDTVYLRLFYIDGLLGWNGEESVPNNAIWITSGIFIPAAIGLHFMASRQTMWPLVPGVHEMNKYGCCSQGLIFPRSVVPQFLEHTDLTTDWLVDMMVEEIADAQGWSRWAVVLPLLQHIGATSSKGYGFDNSASTIWNFRFEKYPV
ncbi:uncharacterized protein BDV14DRAFT_210154 [Aspergillus stella-maris]|uniref:uncharacterized protein n=1 Tax=Aspergillus stella-maris TaxID=1810926 RepID=UPI003CCDF047